MDGVEITLSKDDIKTNGKIIFNKDRNGDYNTYHEHKSDEGHSVLITQEGKLESDWNDNGGKFKRLSGKKNKKIAMGSGTYTFDGGFISSVSKNSKTSFGKFIKGNKAFFVEYNIQNTKKHKAYRVRDLLLDMGEVKHFNGLTCTYAGKLFSHPSRIEKEGKFYGKEIFDLNQLPFVEPKNIIEYNKSLNSTGENNIKCKSESLDDALPGNLVVIENLYDNFFLQTIMSQPDKTPELIKIIHSKDYGKLDDYFLNKKEIYSRDYLELLNIWPYLTEKTRKLILKNMMIDKADKEHIKRYFFSELENNNLVEYLKIGFPIPKNASYFQTKMNEELIDHILTPIYLKEDSNLLEKIFKDSDPNMILYINEKLKEKNIIIDTNKVDGVSSSLYFNDGPEITKFILDSVITSEDDVSSILFIYKHNKKSKELVQAVLSKLKLDESDNRWHYNLLKKKYGDLGLKWPY